jgi:hypothetical protein
VWELWSDNSQSLKFSKETRRWLKEKTPPLNTNEQSNFMSISWLITPRCLLQIMREIFANDARDLVKFLNSIPPTFSQMKVNTKINNSRIKRRMLPGISRITKQKIHSPHSRPVQGFSPTSVESLHTVAAPLPTSTSPLPPSTPPPQLYDSAIRDDKRGNTDISNVSIWKDVTKHPSKFEKFDIEAVLINQVINISDEWLQNDKCRHDKRKKEGQRLGRKQQIPAGNGKRKPPS